MKRFICAGTILWTTAILIFATVVHASAQEKNNYFALKGGLATIAGDLKKADFDTGFNGEAVLGRYVAPHLALEAGVGYIHDGVNKNYGNNIWNIPFTASLKGIYRRGALELYAGGGLGIYLAKFHGMVNGAVGDKWATVFGGHLMAGATVDISPSFFAGLEGKAHVTGQADFQVLRSNLNSRSASAVVGYRF